ncbi:MAG: c-type cytochrome [Gemmataceae bacterium]|nr:c-type cytochrome [Gemmataceae bacterium]
MVTRVSMIRASAVPGAGLVSSLGLAWLLLTPTTAPVIGQATNPPGKALYQTHCAACHGDLGDGNGMAARFLYPRPRDFTAAEFRLVSTTNLLPTDEDMMRAITRGMPGSAMMPFGHLPESERKAMVAYVNELTREGMIRRAVQDARGRGDTPDEKELRREVTEFLKPGERLQTPAKWPAADKASVERGLALYTTNCATCHGATGRGDGAQDQKDANGMPTRPRDFSRGIFKGGREHEQLYARIVLGMKGTPMPGNSALKPDEVGDIVNYIQSLAPADAQAKVEHKRVTITARKVYGSLPDDLTSIWSATPATPIVVSPLWWRECAEPDFRVQAIHDGKSIAIRLAWNDATRDDETTGPDQFEDMAAVQLFRGTVEPFLGMGAEGAPPDLWLWRATWGRPKEDRGPLDEYPFDTAFYRERLKGQAVPDFATARAAGNPHTHADASQSASNLVAKGVGSVTFRPKASQVVRATSSWSNGRRTVEFRRPIRVPTDAGVSLAPTESASIAFALWDGAARDRNGQKQSSIWHDLRLE